MIRKDLENNIIKIVANQIELNESDILLNSTFKELNLDILDYLEIETQIERELNFKIPCSIPSIYHDKFKNSIVEDTVEDTIEDTLDITNISDVKELVDHVERILTDNLNIKEVHISEIKIGDIVLHNGYLQTICPKDLKYDKSMGYSIFGDSYKLGRTLVKRSTSS